MRKTSCMHYTHHRHGTHAIHNYDSAWGSFSVWLRAAAVIYMTRIEMRQCKCKCNFVLQKLRVERTCLSLLRPMLPRSSYSAGVQVLCEIDSFDCNIAYWINRFGRIEAFHCHWNVSRSSEQIEFLHLSPFFLFSYGRIISLIRFRQIFKWNWNYDAATANISAERLFISSLLSKQTIYKWSLKIPSSSPLQSNRSRRASELSSGKRGWPGPLALHFFYYWPNGLHSHIKMMGEGLHLTESTDAVHCSTVLFYKLTSTAAAFINRAMGRETRLIQNILHFHFCPPAIYISSITSFRQP